MARHIKTGDSVMVISGGDRGKVGRVLRILSDQERVVVEGINRVWKHMKPTQKMQQGGRIQKEAPIQMSNVLPVDPSTGKATRVRFEVRDGVKHRIAVASGTDLGPVGRKARK